MGLTHLGKIQIADETTAGTPVTTATALLPVLKAAWQEVNTVDQPEELRGDLAKYHRGAILGKMVNIDVDFDVTYEDFPYWLEMSVKTATPAGDGGGTVAYKRTYTPTLTSPDVPRTKTIQVGDDTSGDAFYAPFAFARNLELSFAIQERTNGKVAMAAQSLTAQAFTG